MGQEQSAEASTANAASLSAAAPLASSRPVSLRKRVSGAGSISGRSSLVAAGAAASLADRISGAGAPGSLGRRNSISPDASLHRSADGLSDMAGLSLHEAARPRSASGGVVVIESDSAASAGTVLPRGSFVVGAAAPPLCAPNSGAAARRDREKDGTSADSARDKRRSTSSPAAAAAAAPLAPPQPPPISKEDFTLLKVIGKGSFGKVFLVQKRGGSDDGVTYAMKTLRKEVLLKRNQIEHTKTERAVLQAVDHPFIVCLRYAFQTTDKLYLVTDFVPGGELFFWLKRDRIFSQARVRIYAAQIVLALEHLHAMDVVYRDLKPENVLLDGEGYIKLTDFGLSKQGVASDSGASSFVGTPEYLAPEILENTGHGKAVDWWSAGILLYEMMGGLPPFYDTNVELMYEKILHAELRFPKHFLPETRSLLSGLLTRHVDRRLGYGGAAEIKAHPFFDGLDWEALEARRLPAPFVPPAASVLDAALAASAAAGGESGAVVTEDGLPSPRDEDGEGSADGRFAFTAADDSGSAAGIGRRDGPGGPATASSAAAVGGAGAGASAAAAAPLGSGAVALGAAAPGPSTAVAAAATAAVVANFEADFTSLAPEDSVVDRSTKLSSTALERTHFEGFTYTGAGELLHDALAAAALSGSGGSSGGAFAPGSSGGAFGSGLGGGLRGGGSAFGSVHDAAVVGSAGSSGFYQENAGVESGSR